MLKEEMMDDLHEKIVDLLRAVGLSDGWQGAESEIADRILALPEIKTALAYRPKGTVRNIVTKEGGTVFVPSMSRT